MNTKLRDARLLAGMTQTQVASKCEISARHYRRIEAGFTPSLQNARRIADAVNSDVDSVFPDTDATDKGA